MTGMIDTYEPVYFQGEWHVTVLRMEDGVAVYKSYKSPKHARAAFRRLDKDQRACDRFFHDKRSKLA